MAVAVRIIPCLDVDQGRVVKGVNFAHLRDAGDPVELAARYEELGADELTFLDVSASKHGRSTMLDVVRRTADQVFIPLTVGGGARSADDVMKFKYIVKNVAWQHGKTATFMPKPIFGDNGSGMHVHSSIWKGGEPLFFDESGYAQLSDMARYYIGGILKHAPSLLAFTNPSANSYHRLVPGFEAPVNLVYSQRNRSACMRIPITGPNPKAKRVEFRCPDPSANPYMAFAALLLAGLDGIQNKIEPPAPVDKDIYELPPEEHAAMDHVPGNLGAVLDNLEADHEFLLAGDVFTPDLIETWVELKRGDLAALQQRPHPYEFDLYYDI